MLRTATPRCSTPRSSEDMKNGAYGASLVVGAKQVTDEQNAMVYEKNALVSWDTIVRLVYFEIPNSRRS